MDWFLIAKSAFEAGWLDAIKLKVWVRKGKISEEQYKEISGEEYSL
jgi:hypothetical protein